MALTRDELIRMHEAIIEIDWAFEADAQPPYQAVMLLKNLIQRELEDEK